MCEHLQPLQNYLVELGIKETYRGQPYEGSREWVYYDCFLIAPALKKKFNLGKTVEVHDYFGFAAGADYGLVCNKCGDAIMGIHRQLKTSKTRKIT